MCFASNTPQFDNNYEFEAMDIDADGFLDLVTINDGSQLREHLFLADGLGGSVIEDRPLPCTSLPREADWSLWPEFSPAMLVVIEEHRVGISTFGLVPRGHARRRTGEHLAGRARDPGPATHLLLSERYSRGLVHHAPHLEVRFAGAGLEPRAGAPIRLVAWDAISRSWQVER